MGPSVGTGDRPSAGSDARNARCDDHGSSSVCGLTSPQPYARKRRYRPASAPSRDGGSSRRIAPAAAFRALLNVGIPRASRLAFSAAKSSSAMNTSPRISSVAGQSPARPVSVVGAPGIPPICRVTSSPTSPSPLDAATTRTPSTYRSDADAPSIFGSAQNRSGARASSSKRSGGPSARVTRATNARTSSSSKQLPSDRIGTACSTCGSADHAAGFAPTAPIGLSSRIIAGCSASSASRRRRVASYAASDATGSASLWYASSAREMNSARDAIAAGTSDAGSALAHACASRRGDGVFGGGGDDDGVAAEDARVVSHRRAGWRGRSSSRARLRR
eukprot:31138-Pelagococcus_subviridis.AAC.1